jgi:D-arabinose 1-dehydrogenase-like Zn-dependent alcohol dehydrogenase
MSATIHRTHENADQAVVFSGLGAFAPKEGVKAMAYNPPKLDDTFVEIEISHCGICGSDIHTMDSGWGPSNYPVIVGHEIIGTVVAAGSAVKNVAVGDRVGVGAQCGSCLDRAGKRKECPECASGWEQHCRNDEMVWTYNSPRPDGQITQGGYADRVRCESEFAFKIPAIISSAEAAPLMCAGVTVFAPLQRYITRPGMKVGIVGIGGLGHLGVMFAAKLLGGSAEVTAISHNEKKKEEALKMGAKYFLNTSDPAQLAAAFRSFDFVLSTANGSSMDLANWLSIVNLAGTFCTVGLPEEPLSIPAFAMMGAQIKVTASGIGSRKEIEEMLAFSAEHNVRPIIQTMPMAEANAGIQKVRDGSVRFRVVLENPAKQ